MTNEMRKKLNIVIIMLFVIFIPCSLLADDSGNYKIHSIFYEEFDGFSFPEGWTIITSHEDLNWTLRDDCQNSFDAAGTTGLEDENFDTILVTPAIDNDLDNYSSDMVEFGSLELLTSFSATPKVEGVQITVEISENFDQPDDAEWTVLKDGGEYPYSIGSVSKIKEYKTMEKFWLGFRFKGKGAAKACIDFVKLEISYLDNDDDDYIYSDENESNGNGCGCSIGSVSHSLFLPFLMIAIAIVALFNSRRSKR